MVRDEKLAKFRKMMFDGLEKIEDEAKRDRFRQFIEGHFDACMQMPLELITTFMAARITGEAGELSCEEAFVLVKSVEGFENLAKAAVAAHLIQHVVKGETACGEDGEIRVQEVTPGVPPQSADDVLTAAALASFKSDVAH